MQPLGDDVDRRSVLARLGGIGVLGGLAGCNGLLNVGGPDLAYGEEIEGRITEDGPEDPVFGDPSSPHSFEGAAGDSVEIVLTSDEFDPYLILTGPESDEVVARDDDGSAGFDSELTVELPADGVYTIWVRSFTRGATGSYTLSLSQG